MGTSELKVGDRPAMDLASIEGELEILVASSYRNREKLWPDGPPCL